MPAIHLVRHGQASFGAGDYDRLSGLGHEQARAVGAALRARGVEPAVVVHGSLRRQRETAAAIAATWHDAPDGPPPLREDARWDEYDHEQLLTALAADPAYAARAADAPDAPDAAADAAAADAPATAPGGPASAGAARAFQAALEEALARWTGGAHDDDAESFAAFRVRVDAALDAAASGGTGAHARPGTTVVVSSAGAIAAVVAAILRTDAEAWAALNRVAVNTGVTTLALGRSGRSLVAFNDHGHLGGPGRPARTTR